MKNNKGQALVEFVILLPIIIMILFIIIDFSFVYYNKNNLESIMNNVSVYKQEGKSFEEIKSTLNSDINLKYTYKENKVIVEITKEVELITPFSSMFFESPYKITTKRVLLDE